MAEKCEIQQTLEEKLWQKLSATQDIREISIILDSLLMLKELVE